jgi:hypothetical protein
MATHLGGKGPLPDVPTNPTVGTTCISEFRGFRELELVTDLAMGEWSLRELAEATGLPTSDIQEFADEHAREIVEVKAALAGQLARETAGMWIVKKQNRLAELQQMYSEVAEVQNRFNNGPTGPTWSRSHKDMVKARLDILRHVADELGAMPQRASQPARTGSTVHYVIDTDAGDLGAMQ